MEVTQTDKQKSETERQADTDRQDRQTDRQKQRETDRQTDKDKETGRETKRQGEIDRVRQRDRLVLTWKKHLNYYLNYSLLDLVLEVFFLNVFKVQESIVW